MISNYFTFLYFVMILSQSEGVSVVGTVDEDTTFYYRELTKEPSLLVTIEYTVIYNRSAVSTSSNIIIYTTEDHINRRTKCINDRYGQLRNENLYGPLREGTFRETTCARRPNQPEMIECHAQYPVQDFIPRNFSFSFGFPCKGTISSLKGIHYNVSVYNQANRTMCEPLPLEAGEMECSGSHEYMTFPSLGGDLSWDIVLDRADYFQNLRTLVCSPNVDRVYRKLLPTSE